MRIHLHIEELVLDGLPVESHHGPRLVRAIETELQTLLDRGGLPAGWRSSEARPSAPAATIHPRADATPAQWGQAIAGGVYGAIAG